MLVSDQGSGELDVVAALRFELAHCRLTLFDHVEEHF